MEEQAKQVDQNESKMVDLAALISDEFGIARQTALMEVKLASEIRIEGEPYEGKNRLQLPYELIEGKKVTIVGETRHFLIDYRG